MTWRELQGSVWDYAQQSIVVQKKPYDGYRLWLIEDFMKAYSHYEKGRRARFDLLDKKQSTYKDNYLVWYEEHVKESVEHEIAGVIMKLSVMHLLYPSRFKKAFPFHWVPKDDEILDFCSIEAPIQDTVKIQGVFVNNLFDRRMRNDKKVEGLFELALCSVKLFDIPDLDICLERRLEYAYRKEMRKGTKFS